MKDDILNRIATITPSHICPRVIYYHSVHPCDDNSMHPDIFRKHMQWLIDNKYTILPLSTLMDKHIVDTLPRNSVAITFDDGYLDNYEFVLPILEDMKLQATFFVVSGLISDFPVSSNQGHKLLRNKHMLSKNMLREMYSFGMEIGSHTKSHINLHEITLKNPERARQEVFFSKTELEDILGVKITAFAYPNGQRGVFSPQTSLLLKEAAFCYSATTIWGSINKFTNPLEISRIEIRNNDTLSIFSKKMAGKYDIKRIFHKLVNNTNKW